MKLYLNRILLLVVLSLAAVTIGGCCYLSGHDQMKCTVATP
jgi:hypothetical protein